MSDIENDIAAESSFTEYLLNDSILKLVLLEPFGSVQ
jgi:hypothetical protein